MFIMDELVSQIIIIGIRIRIIIIIITHTSNFGPAIIISGCDHIHFIIRFISVFGII